MKEHLYKLAAALLVLSVTQGIRAADTPHDPVVNSHPLSFWLQKLDFRFDATSVPMAEKAIKQLGTNAIPFLLFELSAEERAEKENPHSAEDIRAAGERVGFAARALGLLGKSVTSAIPQLQRLMTTGNAFTVQYTASVLAGLGSIGASVIVTGLTNQNASTHLAAATELGSMGTNVAVEVPHLFKILDLLDLDDDTALQCSIAIRYSGIPTSDIVAGFISNLQSKNPKCRSISAFSLGELKASASEAVPELKKLTSDPDKNVRESVIWALDQIQKVKKGEK